MLLINPGLVVNMRSRILFPLVGSLTTCVKSFSFRYNIWIKDKLSEKTRGSHISSADVSEHWNYLKRTITEAISKFVPQKTLGGKQHVPWITTHIKRLIRRRQRWYNAAKKQHQQKLEEIQRDEKPSKKNHERGTWQLYPTDPKPWWRQQKF
jgi:hypothetical protein